MWFTVEGPPPRVCFGAARTLRRRQRRRRQRRACACVRACVRRDRGRRAPEWQCEVEWGGAKGKGIRGGGSCFVFFFFLILYANCGEGRGAGQSGRRFGKGEVWRDGVLLLLFSDRPDCEQRRRGRRRWTGKNTTKSKLMAPICIAVTPPPRGSGRQKRERICGMDAA